MSDPMTNAEVEDVLSSIRRLVSEDKPEDPAPEPPATPDRLVLTPSLRVQEEEKDEAAPDAEEPVDNMPDPDPLALTEFITESRDPATDPDTDEADAAQDPHAAPLNSGPETFLSYVQRGESFNFNPHPDQSDADAVDAEDNQFEEAADEVPTSEWPQDDEGQEDGAYYAPEDVTEQYSDVEDIASDAAFAQDADPDLPEADMSEEHAHPSLSDKIAALETLVADRSDEWEPDDTGAGAYAGTDAPTLAWEDAEAPDTPTFSHFAHQATADEEAAQVEPEPGAYSAQDEVFDDAAMEENVLDEEALRDLVADIVRQELQGALGERITRNVRKLVRREIHRALSAQELE